MDVVDTWTGRKAAALRQALRMSNDAFAEHLGVAPRTTAAWDATPDIVQRPAMQEVLDQALFQASDAVKRRFALLLQEKESQAVDLGAEIVGNLSVAPSVIPLSVSSTLGEIFMAAAHEAARDAILRDTSIGGDAIAQLHEQVVQTARRYATRPPIEVFTEANQIRQLVAQLIERTKRPTDLADLYVISGEATALMSSITFDLGHWDAAVTLAQSSTTDAKVAGHASLEAWTLGLQATLANWRDQPERALTYFERGMQVAPAGASRVRLLYIASRSHALLGDAASTAQVLQRAEPEQEAAHSQRDVLQDEIRGEFRFDNARAAACAGAAWLHMRSGEEAERYTLSALQEYLAAPPEQQPFSPICGARIDTAAARLLRADLDGAMEILQPVLALDPSRRNAAVSGRLHQVRSVLAAQKWRHDTDAQRLAEDVGEWLSDTAAQPLPGTGLN